MRLTNLILTTQTLAATALAGLMWALVPQVAAADTFVSTAQLRSGDPAGLRVSEVRYPYRSYHRPYVAPYYRPSYAYPPNYGYRSDYSPYVARPNGNPYDASRPYSSGSGTRPYYGGYYGYGRPRYSYGFGW